MSQNVEDWITTCAQAQGWRHVFRHEGAGAWSVGLQGDTFVEIEEGEAAMLLRCEVQVPPRTPRLPLYELMLHYNTVTSEADGVRLGIDGSTGHVLLMLELHTPCTHPGQLVTAVTLLSGMQHEWQGVVQRLATEGELRLQHGRAHERQALPGTFEHA